MKKSSSLFCDDPNCPCYLLKELKQWKKESDIPNSSFQKLSNISNGSIKELIQKHFYRSKQNNDFSKTKHEVQSPNIKIDTPPKPTSTPITGFKLSARKRSVSSISSTSSSENIKPISQNHSIPQSTDVENSCQKGVKNICTICNLPVQSMICEHPKLKVIICSKCERHLYTCAQKLVDIDSSDYCSWCLYGGNLFCCDSCNLSFCSSCITRNLGLDFLNDIVSVSDPWACFVCDPNPLKSLQQKCSSVMKRQSDLKSFDRSLIPTKKPHTTPKSTLKKTSKPKTFSEIADEDSDFTDSSSSTYDLTLPFNKGEHPTLLSLEPETSSDDTGGENTFIPLNVSKKKYLKERAERPIKPKIIERVVLEKNDKGDTIVSLTSFISNSLKPHQIEGISFMYKTIVGNVETFKNTPKERGQGCILAHCMGLGKSLQIIAFLESLFAVSLVKTVLILAPLNACDNWVSEFGDWIPSSPVKIFRLSDPQGSREDRKKSLENWFDQGGVMVISYTLYRCLVTFNKQFELFSASLKYALQDPGPDLVICDEGHLIKNHKSLISEALNLIKTRRRIVLTGTPLQNNLIEYYAMTNFVKPDILGSIKSFTHRFITPIERGLMIEADLDEVRLMKKRCHVLHRLLQPLVQRKDFDVLVPYLPPKREYTIYVRPTPLQVALLNHLIDTEVRTNSEESLTHNFLFKMFQQFILIGLHPSTLCARDSRCTNNLLDDFDLIESDPSRSRSDLGVEPTETTDNKNVSTSKPPSKWYSNLINDDDTLNIDQSGKLRVLNSILSETLRFRQKIVVFSQSLSCLDMISLYLTKGVFCPPNNTEKCWILFKHFFRIDGTTSLSQRTNCITKFNDSKNHRGNLMLVSTKAGGLGINLKGASRIVLMDCSWNPSHDVQSMFRVYRIGQDKEVFIYRLVLEGVLEQRIYNRQIVKLSLFSRVVDEKHIERHFSRLEISDLYNISPTPLSRQDVKHERIDSQKYPGLVKVMRDCYPEYIVKYIEHDSLLVEQPDQQLSKQEQDQAMNEYLSETIPSHPNQNTQQHSTIS